MKGYYSLLASCSAHKYQTRVEVTNLAFITAVKSFVVPASSSRGVFPSDLHSYSKRRFSGPPVSPPLRQWEAPVGFLLKYGKLSLVLSFWCIILPFFPTLPLELDQCPTVVETCLDLSRWGKFISGFLSGLDGKLVRLGGG